MDKKLWHFCFALLGLLLSASRAFSGGTSEIKLKNGTARVLESELNGEDPVEEGRYFKQFQIRLEKGKKYQIDLRRMARAFDPLLILRDAGGRMLAMNDDGDEKKGPNSRLVFAPPVTAFYQVITTTFPRGQIGPFQLEISEEGRAARTREVVFKYGSFATFGFLDISDAVEEGKPCKAYACQLAAGKTYRIDLISNEFDAYLYLIGPNGRKLAEDDDSGGNLNSRIIWKADVAGSYRILAACLSGKDIGKFAITVAEVDAKAPSTVILSLDEKKAEVAGRLSPKSLSFRKKSSQAYAVNLEGGKTYRIDLVSDEFDAYLYLLSPDGHLLAEDDDGGDLLNARITYTVKNDGFYQIQACSLVRSEFGNFTLVINEVPK